MGQTQSQGFDPAHVRIYQKLISIRDSRVRHQMINTLLQGQEYIYSAKRAGIYSHLLAYMTAIQHGQEPPPLPGERVSYSQQTTPPQIQSQQLSIRSQQPSNPINVLAKKRASEKALTFFQSCLKILSIEEEVALTDEILRASYKKAVIRAHPDRGGTEEHFEAVTRAYAYLTEILHVIQGQKTKTATGQLPELTAIKDQRATQSEQVKHVDPVRLNPKNLNINAFNQMFEQTRVPDPDEDGYGDWLKNNSNQVDTGKKFGKEFNRDVFNNMFEKEMAREEQQSQLALRQPEALVANMPSGVELGRDRPPDYTAALNASVKFTDLKSAYTKENTFSGQVAGFNVENRSFDSYKTQREKGPTLYNQEEQAALQAWQFQQEQREKQRQLRAAQEHVNANDYHERMKRLVITDTI
jgi:curved DNA-binding protein CbpA